MRRGLSIAAVALIAAAVLGVGWFFVPWHPLAGAGSDAPAADATVAHDGIKLNLISGEPNRVQLVPAAGETSRVKTVEVTPAPPPQPLRLSGSILLDTNSMVRIHSRFPGELTSVGVTSPGDRAGENGDTKPRQLEYGDTVVKDQILAVVWSKDIGEKKSEYVDAISKMDIDEALVKEYEGVDEGVVPERVIIEARGNYAADRVAVAKAERTLRSWRLTEDEIEEIREEAKRVQKRELHDALADRTWAVTEVRSPINGIIMEKNFNVGDLVDPAQDLFKIADLDRVQVMANAYEEDLPLLKNLDAEHRKWKVDVKADPHDVPISGTFDIIGTIIDPTQHAGAILGWLDNRDGRLSIGEFVTATVELPADPTLVAIPSSALFEDDQSTYVFVETDAGQHEFACRQVAVVHRGRERSYIRAKPLETELAHGAEPLRLGEHVIASDVAKVAAEMKVLKAAARERTGFDPARKSS
jgi:cobalt-zinc-cadmium efflux system membrane fusion protein